MKKQFPILKSDEEAERFVAEANLADYDFSQFVPARFEFAPKTERVNMRLPKPLLDAVKAKATARRMPYQRYIRAVLEQAVQKSSK
jgi:predicted DNA binding CopG/RHH family protein